MPAQAGAMRRVISSRGVVSFEIELWHDELHKHRTIKGNDAYLIQRKAAVQFAEWNEQWARRQEMESRAHQARVQGEFREEKKRIQEEQKELAAERTAEAAKALEDLNNTLRHTLSHNDAIDWDKLKDTSPFPKPRPQKPIVPPRPVPTALLPEPTRTDPKYQPQIGILDRFSAARREQKTALATQLFEQDHGQWENAKRSILAANAARDKQHEELVRSTTEAHEREVQAWEAERSAFLQEQQKQNAAIDSQKDQYRSGSPETIPGYCDMVLSNSDYPDFFPKEWEIDYNAETRLLVVDYSLPAPEALPTLVEVKYVAARDEFTEKHLSGPQSAKLYDDLLYQVALRTVHELFEADIVNALAAVTFNGYVRSIDKGTGNETSACVLSLQAKREEFLAVNLANIDPKLCFKQLKGVGSSKLHSVTPVAPIMRIRRDDGRFVSSYDVAHQLDEGYNLAAMNWEDFEHLIREVFGKEFSSNGGEVKVTQASRDGGVDAIAFDPDPIRGGKIVIQAKRYTNTVGVAAVRDLYGTVMNEGATKGILVTTSDYGPDAYEFANGKPLTLLSGANLLHLLEKHGHKAKIDLQEARKLPMEQSVK